ncbi:hypothetical protein SCHPADRAFT_535346 [Schizopora paradoxa]|uniref:Uncharacterized protein n=1 Tax=Schizopora paradoxa TaxID=27342 RepID=A0A0H2RE08_9AGAM|nr:hypothetical protein SCHPADRAFT_535346 [Schizopora paradoxa]
MPTAGPREARSALALRFPSTIILHAANGEKARFTIAEGTPACGKSITSDDELRWSFYSIGSTYETMSDLAGPGRILDNTLRKAGRFLERMIGFLSQEFRSRSNFELDHFKCGALRDNNLERLLEKAGSRNPNHQLKAFQAIVQYKVVDFSLGHDWDNLNKSLDQFCNLKSSVVSWARRAQNCDRSEDWIRYFRLTTLCLTNQDLNERFLGKSPKDRLVECLNLCGSDNACEFGIGVRMLAKFFERSLCPKELYTGVLSSVNMASFLQIQLACGPFCLDVDAVDELAGEIVDFWVYNPFLDDFSITVDVMERILTITELVKRWKDVFKSAYDRIFVKVAHRTSEGMMRRTKASSWSQQEKEELQARLVTIFGESLKHYSEYAGSFTLAYIVYTAYHFIRR